MDLLQLRYFRVVARLEHMTKAPRSFLSRSPRSRKRLVAWRKRSVFPFLIDTDE